MLRAAGVYVGHFMQGISAAQVGIVAVAGLGIALGFAQAVVVDEGSIDIAFGAEADDGRVCTHNACGLALAVGGHALYGAFKWQYVALAAARWRFQRAAVALLLRVGGGGEEQNCEY